MCDKDLWHQKIWDDSKNEINGNKLRLYRCFKKDIFVEKYVTTLIPFQYRQQQAMLRCGSLPIEIELGRRKEIPLQNRICKMCDMDCIENEVHLLLACPVYVRERLLGFIQDNNVTL